MHVYPITLILIILLVLLPDIYLYYRFMRNRINKSTTILHWIISAYFLITSCGILFNINHIISPTTHFKLTMFVSILGMVYATKLAFCTFDLIFFLTKKRWRKIQYAGYVAAGIVFFTVLYSIHFGRFRFSGREEIVEIENLPDSFDGYRILQISDFHLGTFAYAQKRLEPVFDSMAATHPDIVVFTGDMVNNFATECNGWNYLFEKLQCPDQKLAILGNHDYGNYYDWEDEDLRSMNEIAIRQEIRDFGFKLLLNNHHFVTRGNDTIAFIGVENWGESKHVENKADLGRAMKGTENIKTKILMLHDPTTWPRGVRDTTDIPLTLCGHTHGGQFGVDTRWFKFSLSCFLIKYWDGLYESEGKQLFVSRGMGCVGIPARFRIFPHYEVLTLKKKKRDENQ